MSHFYAPQELHATHAVLDELILRIRLIVLQLY